ncbi:hypothetical protein F2P81_025260 [Scophthalmus maximus]|uniref:Uncharacterized protein n=1 Tax=Scophthalmus maximus TaxID=52904 RepID=A0A6A4RVV7_SCOMX|nr:hypothetical protein F2P81_025260 [Scophthalmus maximus]
MRSSTCSFVTRLVCSESRPGERSVRRRRSGAHPAGSVGVNLPKMLNLFRSGHEYLVEDERYVRTQFATLDMPKDQILSNLQTVLIDVCSHRPANMVRCNRCNSGAVLPTQHQGAVYTNNEHFLLQLKSSKKQFHKDVDTNLPVALNTFILIFVRSLLNSGRRPQTGRRRGDVSSESRRAKSPAGPGLLKTHNLDYYLRGGGGGGTSSWSEEVEEDQVKEEEEEEVEEEEEEDRVKEEEEEDQSSEQAEEEEEEEEEDDDVLLRHRAGSRPERSAQESDPLRSKLRHVFTERNNNSAALEIFPPLLSDETL